GNVQFIRDGDRLDGRTFGVDDFDADENAVADLSDLTGEGDSGEDLAGVGAQDVAIPEQLQCQWRDQLLGPQHQTVRSEIDDPVLLRKEGFFAYQLAVVVDDIEQGITDVVRGSDLLEMTAQQRQIYRALGATPPRWLHIPVIVNDQGQKLSKQNRAPALDNDRPVKNVFEALVALGQEPPASLLMGSVTDSLEWACGHWHRGAIHLTHR
ncbi:hypothetical protein LCGC14_1178330, partial [marine sediment metagenome]